jgi:hypothetical protein
MVEMVHFEHQLLSEVDMRRVRSPLNRLKERMITIHVGARFAKPSRATLLLGATAAWFV